MEHKVEIGTRFDAVDKTVSDILKQRALARAETVRAMAPKLKQRAVAVSGVEDAKTLATIREACASVPEGRDWREARKDVEAALEGRVRNAKARAELVLRMNCETARAQARWRDMQREADIMPFLMYSTMGDDDVRPSHRALDGKIFRIDDPFWKTHYPPWDWGCRCTVVQLGEKEAREMCEDGTGQMASKEFMQDFLARFGNEKRRFELDREGDGDFTDEDAMGISEAERKEMHKILSDPAHTVVNERGETENAWDFLWRTGPQAKDGEWLRGHATSGNEAVVVRDAETGKVLERSTGRATEVDTETEWYREGLPGKVRTTHIHPDEVNPIPSPEDLITALQERSEAEHVTTPWERTVTIRPKPAEKLKRKRWEEALLELRRALDSGEMEEDEWLAWLMERRETFGFETGRAEQ